MILAFATLLCDLGVSAVKKKFEYATAAIVHSRTEPQDLEIIKNQISNSMGKYQVEKN